MKDNKHSTMAFDRSEFTEIKADNTEKLRQAKNLRCDFLPAVWKAVGNLGGKKQMSKAL